MDFPSSAESFSAMAPLTDLLNPSSTSTSPRPQDVVPNGDLLGIPQGFAPELFQNDDVDDSQIIKMEDGRGIDESSRSYSGDPHAPADNTMLEDDQNTAMSASPVTMRAPTSKPRKSDVSKMKDTKHSSKNEGQHTDRRYLCYICHKLFTRRRSVRDHIAKIHNTKTWEPVRSLEIIVEPESGEPVGSLEEQIAQGGAAPIERSQNGESQEPEHSVVEHSKPASPPILKTEPSVESQTESIEPSIPAPVIGKKRPFPINKKGTAKLKTSTPNKRPKLTDSDVSTPFRSPSVASVQRGPTSRLSRATQSPASSRDVSIDPSASPTPSAATPGSTNDDGEIFCICRKGDNHTWMIACDGGCEEWYHGNCVNIRERDGDLIDKYICPRCRRDGFQTTWKRMCRRKGCRKPAKVFDDPPSKYCSRDCGRMFFVELIKRGDPSVHVSKNGQYILEMEKPRKLKKRRKPVEKKKRVLGDLTPVIDGSRPHTPAYSDDDKTEYETDSSLDDDMLPNRGGPLRAGELKYLLEKCKTVEEWRALGRKPTTPPEGSDSVQYDPFETARLESIERDRKNFVERDELFKAREVFLNLAKARSATITEEFRKANPKQKELCGYDPRLTWSESEFIDWYKNRGGKEILDSGELNAPGTPASTNNADSDVNMTNGVRLDSDRDEGDSDDDGRQTLPTKDGICIKNRCQRHGSNRWQKAQLAELRFEQDLVRRAIDKLDVAEKGIRDRAIVRAWELRG